MDIADAYRAAYFPTRHVVLGLQLETYSGGHEVLLDAFQSPFISDDTSIVPSFQDLIYAALICSQRHDESRKDLTSPKLEKVIKLWSWRARKLNPADEMLAFQDYIKEGRAFPNEIAFKIVDGNLLSSPSVQRTKIYLMQEMNISEHEFLDRPLALSNADFCCIQEMYGKIRFQGESEQALFKQAKQTA